MESKEGEEVSRTRSEGGMIRPVREVGLNIHRGVERVGFMRRRNWEARRQKRTHGGVGG